MLKKANGKKNTVNEQCEEKIRKKKEISSAQRDEGWMMIKHAHDKYCMQQKIRTMINQVKPHCHNGNSECVDNNYSSKNIFFFVSFIMIIIFSGVEIVLMISPAHFFLSSWVHSEMDFGFTVQSRIHFPCYSSASATNSRNLFFRLDKRLTITPRPSICD